jgi:hypothetical protein
VRDVTILLHVENAMIRLGVLLLAATTAGLAACDRAELGDVSTARESRNAENRVAAQANARTDTGNGASNAPPAAPAATAAPATPAAAPAPASPPRDAIDDSVITAKIKAAILSDPAMTGSDVSVNTDRGVVSLSGNVKSQEQIAMASAHAQRQDGVMRVDTQLSPNVH